MVNPIHSFLRANFDLLLGRLHFPEDRIGEVIEAENGQKYTIFRQMYKDVGPGEEKPQAIFKVCFHVTNMSPERNKVFSLFTIPFFAGLPGFRSKLWLVDEESGGNMGIYEWQTAEDAQNYSQSFAMRFMSRRSIPGSAKYEIINNQ